jgi:hypothetical protein
MTYGLCPAFIGSSIATATSFPYAGFLRDLEHSGAGIPLVAAASLSPSLARVLYPCGSLPFRTRGQRLDRIAEGAPGGGASVVR